ncbi:MAG: hypothetical protein LUD12_09725 [Lachnospiraceae bacterium]|nr:hypothetical protein [Lachnospiraceae bacterium]
MTYEEAFPTIEYHPITVTMAGMKKSKLDTRPFEAQVVEFPNDTYRFYLRKESSRYHDRHHFSFENCLIEYNGHKYFCIEASREGCPKYPVLTAELVA